MKIQTIIAGMIAAIMILGTLVPAAAQSSISSKSPGSRESAVQDFQNRGSQFDLPGIELDPRVLNNDALEFELQTSSSGPFTLEAGPIWSTNEAKQLCPKLCTARGAAWTAQWWTTVPGKMSVCQCK